jgi:hypothetical protein
MNEMIEIRKKPGESVWEIDQRFKRLKGKLKYSITDMQHRKLFVNSLLPHLKYPLRQQKFQTQAEALQASPAVGRKPVSTDRSNNRRDERGSEEPDISVEPE